MPSNDIDLIALEYIEYKRSCREGYDSGGKKELPPIYENKKRHGAERPRSDLYFSVFEK